MKRASKKTKTLSQTGGAGRRDGAIRESELRYRYLFETARDGILIADAATGKIEDVNPYLLELLGFERDEIAKKKVWELHADPGAGRKNFESAQTLESNRSNDLTLLKKDGGTLHVECVSNTFRVGKRKYVQGIIRDIVEHKRGEVALRASEKRLAALVEHGRDNISLLDAGGRLLWESPSSNHMLGYQPEEFVGRDIFLLIHPDDLSGTRKLFKQVARAPGRVANGSFRLRHRDGSWRWAEATATNRLDDPDVAAIIINYRDITERKLAEDALREGAGRLEGLFENSPIPIWEEDFSGVKRHLKELGLYGKSEKTVRKYIQGHPDIVGQCIARARIINVNHACLALHNAPDKRALMEGLEALVAEESLEALREQIVAVATGRMKLAVDSMVRTLDGRLRHVHVHWSILPGYEKSLARVIVSTEDITDRKETEAALRASEERYRMLFDLLPYGGEVLDAKGNIAACSPSTAKMLGYRLEEMVGRPMLDFLEPGSLEIFREKFPKLLGGQPQQAEIKMIRKDGTSLHVLRAASPLFDEAGRVNGILALSVDISQRVEAEQALKASERRFRSMIENSHDAIALLDARGRVLYESPSGLRITGYAAGERLGRGGLDLLHPEDAKDALEALGRVIREPRGTARAQYRVRRKDGAWAWVEAVATNLLDEPGVEAIVVNYHDITERRQAEEALRVNENRFRSMIENSHDAVALIDRHGTTLYESLSAERITGYSLEETVNRNGFAILHPDDLERVQELLARITEKPLASIRTEYRWRHKNGGWIWIEAVAANLLEDPDVGAIIVNYRDITERKQAEAALAEAQKLQNLILESVGEGIYGSDAEGHIVFENAASLKMFGWEAREMLGQKAHALTHHHRANGDVYPVEECPVRLTSLDGKTRYVDNDVFFRKDGTSFPVEYACAAMMDGGIVTGVVVSFRDVAERKLAEEALKHSEEKFSKAFQASPDAILITRMADGQITEVNEGFCRITEYSKNEAVGRTTTELGLWLDPVDRDYFIVLMKQNGHVREREFQYRVKSGRVIDALLSAEMVSLGGEQYLLGIVRDVTGRKKAEEQIRFQSDLLAQVSDAIVAVDLEFNVLYWNSAAQALYGWNARETMGRPFRDFVVNEYPPGVTMAGIIEQIQTRGYWNGEVAQNLRDGTRIPILSTVSVVNDAQGRPVGYVAVNRDITGRKKIEEDVRREKAFSDAIINSMPGIFYLFDTEGKFLRWNANFEKISGYSGAEISVMHPTDFFESAEKELIRERIGRVFETGYSYAEANFVSRDGSRAPFYFTGVRVELDGQVCLLGVGVDVTERRRAEKSLRDLSLAVNASGDVLFMTDKDGLIASVNAQFTDLYGYTPEEVVGKTTPRILKSGKQSPEVYERFWQTILRGELFRGEVINLAKDGGLIPIEETVSPFFDEEGNIAGFLAVQRNIAGRKQAEESLRLAEEKYRALVENIPAVVYLDEATEESRNLYTSPYIEKMLGYPVSAYVENPTLWHQQVDPRDYPGVMEAIHRTLADGFATREYRLVASDGNRVWVRDSAVALRDENGQPQFIQGFIEDITAQKQAEEKVEQSLREITALHSIGQSLGADITLERVVRSAVDGIVSATQADLVMFFLVDGGKLKIQGFGPSDSKFRHDSTPVLRVGECLCGLAAQEKSPVYSANIHTDLRCTFKQCKQAGLQSFASLPLISEGEVIGTLGIASAEERDFETQSLFLEAIAISASVSLRNALLYEKVRTHASELEKEISARKQAESLLEMALIQSPSGVLIASAPDVSIQVANPAAFQIRGGDQKLLTGIEVSRHAARWQTYRPDGSLYPPEQLPLSRAVLHGEVTRDEEVIIRDESGVDHWVSANAAPIRDAQGNITHGIVIFYDFSERKRAEQSLRESEEKYRAVIEQAAEGIALYDGETLQVMQSNSAYCAMLGYTAEEMKKLTLYDIVAHPRESVDRFIERIRVEKKLWIGERQHRRKDGSLLDVEVGSSLILLYGKESLSVLVRDITERKQMEQALVQSERDYRYLFNNAGDAILIFEPENETILQVNATACRLYGFDYDEMIGMSLKSLTRNIERGEAYVSAFVQGEAPNIFESAHVNKDGEEILVLINSSLIEYEGGQAVLALVRDVTEIKRAADALRLSEARLAEAQQIAHLGNWEWNVARNTIWWSDETYRIFGRSPGEFNANVEGFLDTVHPADRELVRESINKALQGTAPYNIDHRILLPDGSEKFVHEQAVVEWDESGNPARMSGVSHDITERKRAEENLQKQISHLRALREIDKAIGSGFDMRQNLNTLLMHASAELNADAAGILMLNPNLNRLEYAAGYGFRARGIEKTSLLSGEGYAGNVAMRRELVRVDNLNERLEQFPRASLLAGERFVCYFGVPLISRGVVKGVLEIFHRSPLDPDQDWLDFLHTLAGQAAIAVENAQLFNNLQQSNFELLHAYDATIEGWSRALDLRDKETEGHTQRVTDMAIRLGQKFGLSDEELKYMRWGGLLHDIGKMGVPDAILFKKEDLTPEEMETMRRHTAFAYEMLSPIRYLKDAVDIPYCHHERWDGAGYPRSLKGEQIPFPARIFAVADVYDAITSDRPYRDKWGRDKALSHIRANAGTHFDPRVVETFLLMVEEEFAPDSSV